MNQQPESLLADRGVLILLSWTICASLIGYIGTGSPSSQTEASIQGRAETYERAARVFSGATLFKPARGGDLDARYDLAPLILIESGSRHARIERVMTHTSNITWRNNTYREQCSSWRLLDEAGREIREQGLRILLDGDGLPRLWRLLDDANPFREFYVSQAIEDAAREQFGPALVGRRFIVEADIERFPDVITTRILSDGPVPMGPWVYIEAETFNVTTLLCRCMDSQVEGEIEISEYSLIESEACDLLGPSITVEAEALRMPD